LTSIRDLAISVGLTLGDLKSCFILQVSHGADAHTLESDSPLPAIPTGSSIFFLTPAQHAGRKSKANEVLEEAKGGFDAKFKGLSVENCVSRRFSADDTSRELVEEFIGQYISRLWSSHIWNSLPSAAMTLVVQNEHICEAEFDLFSQFDRWARHTRCINMPTLLS
jgi:hypothetical protein